MPDSRVVFRVKLGELAEVPGTPFAYWAPQSLRDLFQRFPPLDRDVARQPDKPKIADAKVGLQTSDDLRFTRYWWEVPVDQIATSRGETLQGKKWVPYSHSIRLLYFWGDIALAVSWENDGEEIRNFSNSVIRNKSFYFRPGLAWSTRTQRSQNKLLQAIGRIPLRILPPGCIFSRVAQAVVLYSGQWEALSLLASHGLFWIFKTLVTDRATTSSLAILPVAPAALANSALGQLAHEAHDLLREWDTGNEVSTQFIRPWMLQVWFVVAQFIARQIDEGSSESPYDELMPVTGHPLARDFRWSEWESARAIRQQWHQGVERGSVSLWNLARACVRWEMTMRQRLDEIQRQIDDEVYRLYDISDEDSALIEAELGAPAEEEDEHEGLGEREDEGAGEDEEPAAPEGIMPPEEHIRRLIHYLAHQAICEDADGIVPLSDTYTADRRLERGLAARVREKLQTLFGEQAMMTIERELQEALGRSLDEWMASDFFEYHVGLYRLRPIIWQLVPPYPSGRRRRGASSCFGVFIYWHKLDADTLRKVQRVYLQPHLNALEQRVAEAERRLVELQRNGASLRAEREAERQLEAVRAQWNALREMNARIDEWLRPRSEPLSIRTRSAWVEEKANEIVAGGYRPNRDYGVRVNIEPLKQAGLLPPAADRVKG